MSRPSPIRRAIIPAMATLFACVSESPTPELDTTSQVWGSCLRAPARPIAPGEDVLIADVPEPPCVLELRETGIELLPDSAARWPDPGRDVVRDSRGYFYSANSQGFRGVINVWDAAGSFVRTIGRPGPGPGELSARGALIPLIDSQDRLHVSELSRWSLFSPAHEFITSYGPRVRATRDRTFVLDDGRILSSSPMRADPENYFHIVDLETGTIRGFAPVDDAVRSGWVDAERAIAYAGGDLFWAGPAPGDGRGYVLELWNTDGELVRTLRRDVPWFPAGLYAGAKRATGPPFPIIDQLHLDGNGLLIAAVSLPREPWGIIDLAGESIDHLSQMLEGVVEVIDTRTADLLASVRLSVGDAMRWFPEGFFPPDNLAYRIGETDLGLPQVIIVEYELNAATSGR